MFPLLISNGFVAVNPFSLKRVLWAFSVVQKDECLPLCHRENILLLLMENMFHFWY